MLFLFHRKGSTGLLLSPRSVPFGLFRKSPHLCCLLRVVFSAKTLCKPPPRYLLFAWKTESAYSDLWTHKNVTMDKMKVNKQLAMKEKGNCTSSHYRISNDLIVSEQPLASKFVQWDVNPRAVLTTLPLRIWQCLLPQRALAYPFGYYWWQADRNDRGLPWHFPSGTEPWCVQQEHGISRPNREPCQCQQTANPSANETNSISPITNKNPRRRTTMVHFRGLLFFVFERVGDQSKEAKESRRGLLSI